MGYTPKHAKPASLTTNTAATRRHAALHAMSGRRGRHAAPGAGAFARQGESTADTGLRAA